MVIRAGMSEVKFKVRLNALLLCGFTAEQMVRITGLKPESVRTELQRMKQDGLLEVTHSSASSDQKRKRGGQPALYRLVSDPEKRLALSRSVETFHSETPRTDHPTSRHYQIALQLLDKVANEKVNIERDSWLSKAEEELEFALSEEGTIRAPESVRAHIELQRGRLAYLRGQDGHAAESFRQAYHALIGAGQTAEALRAEEFLLCIEIRRRWGVERGPEECARYLLKVLEPSGFQASSPLVQLMADLMHDLSQTPQARIITDVKPPVTVGPDVGVREDWLFQKQLIVEIEQVLDKFKPATGTAYTQQQPEEFYLDLFARAK